jgi:hypothetical protein
MKYRIVLINPSVTTYDGELLLETDSDAVTSVARAELKALSKTPTTRRGPKGRSVIVLSTSATADPDISKGLVWPNARVASSKLGFGYNAVFYALQQAAACNLKAAGVAGVVVAYQDDMPAESAVVAVPVRTGKPGRAGRSVRAIGILDTCPFRIAVGTVWASADEASQVLGFSYNAVSYALKRAALKNEASALVKGLELQYTDAIEGRI